MRKESNRLKTFQMYPPWPKDYVDIKKLAKAGFFYAFNGDNVHCAFCRGQVCQWDREDDPMSEHTRHFNTCPFIMGGEVGNEPIGEDPFPGPKRPRPYDVCGPFPSYPLDDPRSEHERQIANTYDEQLTEQQRQEEESLRDHDVSRQEAQHQSQHEIDNHPYDHFHDQNNNNHRRIHHHNHEQQQQPSAQASNPTLNNPHEISESRIYTSHNYPVQQANLITTNHSSPSAVAAPNSLTGICKICYTNSIELVFLPCGHSVSCLSCAQRLFNCPCCRETITTRIRTYLV